ncbi:hypothetical protein C1645_830624 [Glomus cerebriforme]|uniref:Uncharacterized protein n=1 Tax=Glomus cerebriforme TaxID=658196 RepID=A0A397SIW1_9GLOM|nr:hypothetical protein C1645_830624 [Glomus cerebriforme]
MIKFNVKDEQFINGSEMEVDDGKNFGNSIITTCSLKAPTLELYSKNSLPLMPTKIVTPADAATMLDVLIPQYNNSTYMNHDKKINYKHHVHEDENQPRKKLKRSISFDHSQQKSSNQNIDVAKIMSNEQNDDNYMDFIMSDNSTEYWQSNNRNDIENEIAILSTQLYEMNQKYIKTIELKENDKNVESFSNQLLRCQSYENECHDKQMIFDSLNNQLEILKKQERDTLIEDLKFCLDTSIKVITELREKNTSQNLLKELREKNYIIDNLTQQILKEQIAQIEPLKKRIEETEDIQSQLIHKVQLDQKIKQFEYYLESLKNISENDSSNNKIKIVANSEKTVKIMRLEETNQLKEVEKLKQKMDEKEKELKLAKSKSYKYNSRKSASYKSRKISDGLQLTHMRNVTPKEESSIINRSTAAQRKSMK